MRSDGSGIIQVYYGDGKGKTTSAVGQAIRAAGSGFSVFFIQFLKSGAGSGEIGILKTLPEVAYEAFGSGRFLAPDTIGDHDRKYAAEGLDRVREIIDGRTADMLVLDEIGAVLELGLANAETVLALLDRGKGWLDIVMTGRTFPESVLARANAITRMEKVRHHFDSGAGARRGIEY